MLSPCPGACAPCRVTQSASPQLLHTLIGGRAPPSLPCGHGEAFSCLISISPCPSCCPQPTTLPPTHLPASSFKLLPSFLCRTGLPLCLFTQLFPVSHGSRSALPLQQRDPQGLCLHDRGGNGFRNKCRGHCGHTLPPTPVSGSSPVQMGLRACMSQLRKAGRLHRTLGPLSPKSPAPGTS